MTAVLSPVELDRLRNICARLSSDFDGERAAAALLATRLLKTHRLTWADVVMPALPAASRPVTEHSWQDDVPNRDDGWRGTVTKCRRHLHLLNDFEREFLSNREQFPRLSLKQNAVLNRICAKLKAHGCRV